MALYVKWREEKRSSGGEGLKDEYTMIPARSHHASLMTKALTDCLPRSVGERLRRTGMGDNGGAGKGRGLQLYGSSSGSLASLYI